MKAVQILSTNQSESGILKTFYVSISPFEWKPGAVFTKGLSQVFGLSWLYFYTKVKLKTWLRPFMNTAPEQEVKLTKTKHGSSE